ncbi:hypothetical protein NP493_634g00007 [Ridgeia piscesae]|uniref:Uncharacterized protein n=1 Tax=Ridgeia piscesae TaxID=27915 RepID=A0AAD9KU10_RIDPI|nr:hypothetical protein NP493_634g00007 [Ridgeia piscesae]
MFICTLAYVANHYNFEFAILYFCICNLTGEFSANCLKCMCVKYTFTSNFFKSCIHSTLTLPDVVEYCMYCMLYFSKQELFVCQDWNNINKMRHLSLHINVLFYSIPTNTQLPQN